MNRKSDVSQLSALDLHERNRAQMERNVGGSDDREKSYGYEVRSSRS